MKQKHSKTTIQTIYKELQILQYIQNYNLHYYKIPSSSLY